MTEQDSSLKRNDPKRNSQHENSVTGEAVTTRIALGIEYNGSQFNGYQLQTSGTRTVQGELEKALSKVAAEPIRLSCAGRTDTGVHATGQVVHFDTHAKRELKAWMLGGNTNLPRDIAVHWVRQVSDDFSARFSAVSRSYRYLLYNRKVRPAVFQHNVAWSFETLHAEKMHDAAQLLLGERDFSAFCSSQCQAKHANREMQAITVRRMSDYIVMDIKANAFLHHMVRNIMGTLMVVGRGEQPVSWVADVVEGCDRKVAGMTASAAGLYLVDVEYPEHHGLPERSGWLPDIC